MRSLLAGESTLSIMPTGYGKTLCFQLPVHLGMKPAIVISPLVALMMDQVRSADAAKLRTDCINSAQSAERRRQALRNYIDGKTDILYVSPERLSDDMFLMGVLEFAKKKPALIVVDEAHCVTDWGHDFRPDYLMINSFIKKLPGVVVLAQTATASPKTREEIMEAFGISKKNLFHGFKTHRDNLDIRVQHFDSKDAKDGALQLFIKENRGPGLVYTTGIETAEKLATKYQRLGYAADFFHSARKTGDKSRILEQFKRGEIEILFCTNAFGLGINIPGIRYVVHYRIPASFDQYVQEIGRAGRDGLPAVCALYMLKADMGIQERFINETFPDGDKLSEKIGTMLTTFNKHGIKRLPKFGDDSNLNSVLERELVSLGYLEIIGEVMTSIDIDAPGKLRGKYVTEGNSVMIQDSADESGETDRDVIRKIYRMSFEGKLAVLGRSDPDMAFKIIKSPISAPDMEKIWERLDGIRAFKRTRLRDLQDFAALKTANSRISEINRYFS
ncbi:MAG: RecQ familyATP-dependent DNA helicase [Elusimicrobia bacterium]|nr:MAG: RecQ familyATP-dependent DNA helicase [Elusimicrobiota bacterium]KAF0155715.1 MAG: RecQ familyATP-dependent DNA helicase [Elusimicrobiota bacterium]